MSTKVRALTAIGGFFFTVGFVFSKIRFLPIPIVSPCSTLISFLSNIVGFAFWLIATRFYPEEYGSRDGEWYSFAQFKEQLMLSAAIGMVANIFSILSLFVPILIIPSVWLLFLSNALGTLGEYNKLKNPPTQDESYSHSAQEANLSYSVAMSGVATIYAISTTLIFLFPPVTLVVTLTSTFISLGLGILGGAYWIDSNFLEHPNPPPDQENSYSLINHSLGPSIIPEDDLSSSPYHGAGLMQAKKPAPELIEMVELHSSIKPDLC